MHHFWKSILVFGAVFIVSIVRTPTVYLEKIPFQDKLAHIVLYFVLTAIFFFDLKPLNNSRQKKAIFAIGIPFFYGCIIELWQGVFTNHRSADLYDVLANLTGIISSFVVLSVVFTGKKTK